MILNLKKLYDTDINRIMRADEIGHIKPRILIISVSPDSPYQYISIMNCIFSAQKLVSSNRTYICYQNFY